MANRRHFWSIILWCSISFQNSCHSQGYYYKHSNVSQYHIINGNYHHIPEKPSTTPEPTLFETIFPWKGGAYDSIRTPEEDAAILSSISDHEPAASENVPTTVDANGNSGIFSWLPSFPSFGSSSSSSSQTTENPQYPNPIQFPGGMFDGSNNAISGNFQNPPGPNHLMHDGSNNAITGNFQNAPVPGAGLYFPPQQLEFQPVGVSHISPPPPPENHQLIPVINSPPPPPPHQYQQMPPMQQIPYEVRNNLQPTFQFHQQMKDAVPVPTPSINSLQPPMMPYPYSSGGNSDYGKGSANEKSPSFFDMLSNYFTFGKRSDLDVLQPQNPRSYISMAMTDREDKVKDDENENSVDAESDAKETEPSGGDVSSSSPPDANSNKAEFPCPKSGIWRWNGDVCIAVGPVPVWACRPNDLVVSGKIAICRNKIYFSPKVIAQPNGQSNQTEN